MSSPPYSTPSPRTDAEARAGRGALLTVVFDRLAAATALVLLSPVLALAALAVRLSDPGPALFRAWRAGRGGVPFLLYKFRTMRTAQGVRPSAITGGRDPRVFAVGRVLRALKIDELPQLWNVVRGDMALVGPRPEDPGIVARHYAEVHLATLAVRPGVSSAGSLYYHTHLEHGIADADPERDYVERVLPVKLGVDLVGIRRASFGYALAVIARTVGILAARLLGRRRFAEPPELADAYRRGLVVPARHE